MATFVRDLEANVGETIAAAGRRFNYLRGYAPVVVEINGKPNKLNPGMGLIMQKDFREVYIESAADMVGAEFYIGNDEIVDHRSDVGAAGFSANHTGVLVSVSPATRKIEAIPNQRGIFVRLRVDAADKTLTMTFTDSTGTDNGLCLHNGEMIYLPVACDLWIKKTDGEAAGGIRFETMRIA